MENTVPVVVQKSEFNSFISEVQEFRMWTAIREEIKEDELEKVKTEYTNCNDAFNDFIKAWNADMKIAEEFKDGDSIIPVLKAISHLKDSMDWFRICFVKLIIASKNID